MRPVTRNVRWLFLPFIDQSIMRSLPALEIQCGHQIQFVSSSEFMKTLFYTHIESLLSLMPKLNPMRSNWSSSRDLALGVAPGACQRCDSIPHAGHAYITQQQNPPTTMQPDEEPQLFEQCRVCIVCTDLLPLETAEQVCFPMIYNHAHRRGLTPPKSLVSSSDRRIRRRTIDP